MYFCQHASHNKHSMKPTHVLQWSDKVPMWVWLVFSDCGSLSKLFNTSVIPLFDVNYRT